jgi:hypothetical protein
MNGPTEAIALRDLRERIEDTTKNRIFISNVAQMPLTTTILCVSTPTNRQDHRPCRPSRSLPSRHPCVGHPAAIIVDNYRSITIETAAEDDCPYVYGTRHITAVIRDGDHVSCQYR